MSDDLYRLLRRWGLTELGANSVRHLIEVVGILVIAVTVSRLTNRAARAQTLGSVTASVIRIVVWTLAALFILGEVGLNLGPLIAGASIVGVALGFGAQTLVKDFLAGFFILAEDQYGVGDEVSIGGESASTTGVVEELSLRVTRLRGADGTVWFVPNGEIRRVGNRSRAAER